MIIGKYLPALVLASAMSFFAYDIISDVANDGDSLLHIAVELLVFVAISFVLFRELQHVKSLQKGIKNERSKTARLAGELLSVIRDQFSQWNLSPSESDVALFLIKGLLIFGVLFAVNSALHSYLIVSYADEAGVSLDVGFYYMANAMGRLLGTVLSGSVFQVWGLPACLWISSIFIGISAVVALLLPRHPDLPDDTVASSQ